MRLIRIKKANQFFLYDEKIDWIFFSKPKSTSTPEMNSMTEINYCSDYKTFGGFKYHLNFPDEWIRNELPNTGRQCWNCVGDGDNKGYGMWRGVILGYCSNCATDYNMTRCRGFIGCGIERDCSGPSAFDLYLGEIDWDNYGDLEANSDDTLEKRKMFLEHVNIYVVDSDENDDDYDENDDDEEEDPDGYPEDHYYPEEDDFGTCIHIGCEEGTDTGSSYCIKHRRKYDP